MEKEVVILGMSEISILYLIHQNSFNFSDYEEFRSSDLIEHMATFLFP